MYTSFRTHILTDIIRSRSLKIFVVFWPFLSVVPILKSTPNFLFMCRGTGGLRGSSRFLYCMNLNSLPGSTKRDLIMPPSSPRKHLFILPRDSEIICVAVIAWTISSVCLLFGNDKLKSCLPAGAVNYVLSLQGNDRFDSRRIGELADTYASNHIAVLRNPSTSIVRMWLILGLGHQKWRKFWACIPNCDRSAVQ